VNINTSRVANKHVCGPIRDEKKLKLSQEYFALAFLKYIFPDKYKDVFHADRPDLQGRKVLVEVTSLNTCTDMQASKEFAKYSEDRKERRIKTIEGTGYALRNIEGINATSMCRGGGYNFESDYELLKERILEKINKAKGYEVKNRTLELALVKEDHPFHEWIEKIPFSLEQIVNNQEIYETVYILFPNGYIYIIKGESPQISKLSKNEYLHLKSIGRMTAEEELTMDDEEWK
jgi:hypothetical protein